MCNTVRQIKVKFKAYKLNSFRGIYCHLFNKRFIQNKFFVNESFLNILHTQFYDQKIISNVIIGCVVEIKTLFLANKNQ